MVDKKANVLSSGFLAMGSHYLLWKVSHGKISPPEIAWIVSVSICWGIGFLIGWKIQPGFVSRRKRYVTSSVGQSINRVVMGIAWGGVLGLLGGLVAQGITQ